MSIDNLLIKPNSDHKQDIVSQCCVCQDFVSKEGQYMMLTKPEIEKVYSLYLVSHGYCDVCIRGVLTSEQQKIYSKNKRKEL